MEQTQAKTEYLDIFLTDIQLHAQKMPNPAPLLRAVEKTVRSNKPSGRAYGKISNVNKQNFTMEFSIPLDDATQARIKKAKNEGKKIRIFMPQRGLNMYLGSDAMEKIAADKRKKDSRFDTLLRR